MSEDDIEMMCVDLCGKNAHAHDANCPVGNAKSAPAAAAAAARCNTPIKTTAQTSTTSLTTHNVPIEIQNLIAGGLAGMFAKSVVAPIDRIKILFQVTSQPFLLRNVPLVAMNIYQLEGIRALWRGNSAMMLRVFPYSGIQFMVFDKCKAYIIRHSEGEHHLSPMESLLAGSLAGVVSVFATYPLDLTRAQLAVSVKKKVEGGHRPTFFSTLASTYTKKGMAGLFQGITPTVLGILPYAGIAFTINEQGKRRIKFIFGRDASTVEKMIVGGAAGLVAQTLTYPLEVTRRRMQTNGLVSGNMTMELLGGKNNSIATSITATTEDAFIRNKGRISMTETIKILYKEQGIHGFFKGVTMNWIKGPVAFSISFTTYDILKGWIQSQVASP